MSKKSLKSYQQFCSKIEACPATITARLSEQFPHDRIDFTRLLHAQIGIAGEAGELADALKKWMVYGQDLDLENLKEECGDLLYYLTIMIDELGESIKSIAERNRAKLEQRYPEGEFSEKAAFDRADKSAEVFTDKD